MCHPFLPPSSPYTHTPPPPPRPFCNLWSMSKGCRCLIADTVVAQAHLFVVWKKKTQVKTTHTSCERERRSNWMNNDWLFLNYLMSLCFTVLLVQQWRLVRLAKADWIISRRKKRGRRSKVTQRSLIPKVPGNLRPGLLSLCPTCWVLDSVWNSVLGKPGQALVSTNIRAILCVSSALAWCDSPRVTS